MVRAVLHRVERHGGKGEAECRTFARGLCVVVPPSDYGHVPLGKAPQDSTTRIPIVWEAKARDMGAERLDKANTLHLVRDAACVGIEGRRVAAGSAPGSAAPACSNPAQDLSNLGDVQVPTVSNEEGRHAHRVGLGHSAERNVADFSVASRSAIDVRSTVKASMARSSSASSLSSGSGRSATIFASAAPRAWAAPRSAAAAATRSGARVNARPERPNLLRRSLLHRQRRAQCGFEGGQSSGSTTPSSTSICGSSWTRRPSTPSLRNRRAARAPGGQATCTRPRPSSR